MRHLYLQMGARSLIAQERIRDAVGWARWAGMGTELLTISRSLRIYCVDCCTDMLVRLHEHLKAFLRV